MGTRFDGWFSAGSVRRRVVVVASTVVALALVILAVAAVSAPKKSAPTTSEVSTLDQADRLAEDAAGALSREDTQTALDLATRALALDPGNGTAARIIDVAEKAEQETSKTAPDPSSGATPSVDPYASVVKDIAKLLPARLTDWTRGQQVVQGGEALVTFEPNVGSRDEGTAVRVLVSSHDRGSSASAKEFVNKVTKTAFPVAGSSVQVGTVADGYTGVDASRQVVVGFARGRYAFEVILVPQQGVKADAAKVLAAAIAGRHPAAR